MRKSGHIRERSPGSFELRYSLGTDPATGKRRTATATVTGSRKDADKELRRLLRSIDTGEHVDPNRITMRRWLTTWLASIKDEVSPKTHERYTEYVENYFAPALGNLQLAKLAPSHIQDAYTKWSEGGRSDHKSGGLSPRTRRHMHTILRACLGRAVEQQLIVRNPTDPFKKRQPKVERHEMATLTADQSAILMDAIKHTRVYCPVLIALATGMRRGEVLALRWKNIDLERGMIRVMESLEQTKAGLRFKRPKTDKSRAVALPSYAVEELKRIRVAQAESLLALGVRQTGETLVCPREDGEPLQPRSLTHEFTRLAARVKDIPRVRFHDLRHSHATQLLLAGVHPKIAQERLGHSTITTTLDLYSHVSDTMQEDAAAKLDTAFRSAITGVAAGKNASR